MSTKPKNETLILFLALLITGVLIALGLGFFRNQIPGLSGNSGTGGTGGSGGSSIEQVSDRLSTGDRILVSDDVTPDKQAGIDAIKAGNFGEAVTRLEASLRSRPNDPEALIYLNNARIGTNRSYEIAVSVPIGSDINGAKEMLRGVAQAQNAVNQAGGIGNVPLKVLIANDDDSADTVKEVAAALVADPDVLGVVGHFASDTTIAASEVYTQGKLVSISPVSTSVKLSGLSPYTFRTVPSDYVAARALANYMQTTLNEQRSAVFFNSQSGYSQSLKSEFVTALSLGGAQVTNEYDLSQGGFSPAQSVNEAIAQQATVLALFPNSGLLDRALQVAEVNGNRLKLLGGDDVYSPKTLEVGGASAVDMIVAVPWHVLAHQGTPFVNESRQLWGGDVNWRTAMTYDAAAALIAALGRNPTRDGVEQALRSPDFSAQGASETVRFLPSGDRNQGVQLVTVKTGNRSGFGYDFVPIP
ncbi:amino acid ABC transporter substrate-binding protein [Microcoleus sp. FACHB-1515]|uniref:ABC transporter substrate-binding protein n=1 Tax=Cyanophyceae TaxID=3028117 RepID=UPI00168359F9|nr:ABC transporter substrate-binding protein [Microcoleus sp. FACHB-1515]MBD2089562.1 amino acid ABC transporter substrate-binding protein [Microcoleus sp. FACHB-1515]